MAGQVLALRDSGLGLSYLYGDHLGSVSASTNASGSAVQRRHVDALRKQEVRRLQHVLPEDQRDDLKRTMWLVRKNPDDLSDDEQERLTTLLQHSPALQQAHTLREELTRLFETARSKADGLRRIRCWCGQVKRSGLTCFDGFLALLETWGDRIANYFIDHQTSSFVEGLNNKLKVLKRRCYGLRNIGRLFQRLTLDMSGYPVV